MKRKVLALAVAAVGTVAMCNGAFAQIDYTWQYNSHPMPPYPSLSITDNEGNKVSHVDAFSSSVTVTAEPYIPVRYFNGTYLVEGIPYSPADTTFCFGGAGQSLPIITDDQFGDSVNIPFDFYFFGYPKTTFRMSDNGIVTLTDRFYLDTMIGGSYDNRCPYRVLSPLPWTPNDVDYEGREYFNRLHDAIYGINEDMYFGFDGSYLSGNEGAWYDVVGTAPSRKVICSWNAVPIYNDVSKRETFQIVMYEATNIIEVHVKRRRCCTSVNMGNGIIGIQNATGLPQVHDDSQSSTMYVVDGSPAAFWPTGFNLWNGELDSVSFRFTPQGNSTCTYEWYRLFASGDSIVLTTDASDTNGYYLPMDYNDFEHPTRTQLVIPQGVRGTYVLKLRFVTPSGYFYDLYDTVASDMSVYTVTALASDTTMGTVSGEGQYSEGNRATLTAITFKDYAFRGWDNGEDDNPYQLTVLSDTVVTALFSSACDTIYIRDTVYVGIDGVEDVVGAKIYLREGREIVVEAGDSLMELPDVTVYDATGRAYTTYAVEGRRTVLCRVPSSGVYLVKVGNHPARRIVVVR